MMPRTHYLATAVLALALGGTPALAFSGSIQARVPFPFVVGDVALPAADYIIDVAGDTSPNVLAIRDAETGHRVMFDTSQIPEKNDPKTMGLVFDTVGDKTFLTEVWGVTASGREVKRLVDGRPVERALGGPRYNVPAVTVVDGRDGAKGSD